jgi:CRP-like cAMP-binding protein
MERGIGSYRKIPLFRNLSLSDARRVILAGSRQHHQPGDIIYREGDLGKGMFLILQGSARLQTQEEKERRAETIDLGQGDVFGEIGLPKPGARTATATAIDKSVLLHITEQTLNDLEQEAPKVAFTLYLNLMATVEGHWKKD